MTQDAPPPMAAPGRGLLLALAACISIYIAVINGTTITVALPFIAEEFGVTKNTVLLVNILYFAVFGYGNLLYGSLVSNINFRYLMTASALLFALGSLLGFWSPNFVVLVIARIFQATGASGIPSLTMIMLARYFPHERRLIYWGWLFAMVALGTGSGPFIGGLVTGCWQFRGLFAISALIVLTIPVYLLLIPREITRPLPFDRLTAGMLLTVLFLLSLGLNVAWYYLILAFALLAGIMVVLPLRAKPFFVSAVLGTQPLLLLYCLAAGLNFFIANGPLMFMPLYFREFYILSPLDIGLLLLPASVMAALFCFCVPRLLRRHGHAGTLKIIYLLMLPAALLLPALLPYPNLRTLQICCLGCLLLGYGATHAVLSECIPFLFSDARLVNQAFGLYNMAGFIGGAVGVAILSRVLRLAGMQAYLYGSVMVAVFALVSLVVVLIIIRRLKIG